MPFTKFTNLDFDQIKTSIKDYLRANSNFTDFDFEGSNFSVLIDTLAYNTYITAFNSNMVVNESFLDSATLRENVVSLARNIGYVPKSRQCAEALVSFTIQTDSETPTVSLQAGLVCVGSIDGSTYIFSIPENVSKNVVNGTVSFDNLTIYQGTYLTKQFTVDGSLDQKFILDNPYIDTKTIVAHVKGPSDSGLGTKYSLVDNIVKIDELSEIYLIQEVKDEKYQLIFGDGRFGKKLENGSIITVSYIVTDGKSGNGAKEFSFAGTFKNASDVLIVPTNTVNVTTSSSSVNGSDIEPIDSIKYFAPRLYSSQYRAVTAKDYEAIIPQLYQNTESVSVVGGEEMDPPEYGSVTISIKPKNGIYVSDFDKQQLLSKLKQYSLTGINQKIVDLKILYVEIDSSVYYDYSKVSSVENLKTKVTSLLTTYSKSVDLNKFGGRFKYSKILQVIDNSDISITSNITKVRIRRNLKVAINDFSQYELCYGNRFHIKQNGYNIKSTGFTIANYPNTIVYFTDTPNTDGKTGVLSIIKLPNISSSSSNNKPNILVQSAGTIDYEKGEIMINTIKIISTELPNDVIEMQAYPESNDVIGLKDLYLEFDISKSQINMVKDVIASGEDISGVVFSKDSYRSSYSNGEITRG
jgi:hypothetical protein